MKLALLFDHFGPYHLARLRAAAQFDEVLGVEFRGRSQDYSWEIGERADLPLKSVDEHGAPVMHGEELCQRLASVLNSFRPDVVAVPGWSGREASAALRWCLQHRVPAVLMTESTAHDEVRSPWKEAVKSRLVRLFSAALAGGSAHADYLAQLGMPPEKTFLGYDAVDNDHFTTSATPAAGPPFGGFLGSARFIVKKNLPNLLRAYAKYRDSAGANAWSLTLLGDGPLRSQIEGLVAALKLQNSVTMPGFKQYAELPAFYASAAAFVHASTTEQWGLVVNEAMASGLPVLVSARCGCTPDLVRDGVNGFVIDPFDVDAIAQAMTTMASLEPARRRQMGQESRNIIAQWGPERFGSGLHAAGMKALEAGPVQPRPVDRLLLKLLMNR